MGVVLSVSTGHDVYPETGYTDFRCMFLDGDAHYLKTLCFAKELSFKELKKYRFCAEVFL